MPEPVAPTTDSFAAALEAERLVAATVHDLRSPLLIIQGFVASLECTARKGDWSRFADDVARIERTCGHMQRILFDLAELTRQGSLKLDRDPVSLGEVWQSACEQVPLADNLASLKIQTPEDWPCVPGHRTSLVRLFQNLLDNALRHLQQTPQPRIDVAVRRDPSQVVVTIADNGDGIDPELIPALFQPYRQLSGRAGSVGLGLAIARRIAQVHGGDVTLTSPGAGQGTTATVTLRAG